MIAYIQQHYWIRMNISVGNTYMLNMTVLVPQTLDIDFYVYNSTDITTLVVNTSYLDPKTFTKYTYFEPLYTDEYLIEILTYGNLVQVEFFVSEFI